MMASGENRVVVAMSGGVDSSLAAALLKQQGYDVIGATMQLWSPDLPYGDMPANDGCCSLRAVEDARAVTDALGIPFYVFSMHELFRREVVVDFVREYSLGRTPNPCIRCNAIVKFRAFLDRALALGAQHMATGHYARVLHDQASGRLLLAKARDTAKDQTYALFGLAQQQLQHVLFPLGDLLKTDVREMAQQLGFANARKPDSQEICFVPDNDYRRFMREVSPESLVPGPIVNADGEEVGQHGGLAAYTIGQRKGLGAIGGRRVYVTSIDTGSNTLAVGTNDDLMTLRLRATDLQLISPEPLPAGGVRCTAKIRYSAPEVPAMLVPQGGSSVVVEFGRPVRAVTPGQAVVFYQGDVVLGGATIVNRI